MPLDRALARLRQTGQRAALVGSAEAPLGLVTLKDLVEEISGELHRW
jgi:CBS domain containing-hemolysin-like protein